eukprot:c7610_g2_i1.p1 GENE.c7610_g2_i1~~c7610_g2_i1.p1  ORF type:complete len:159 (+),score=19.24 c7610_g2_i1:101-577(+)
MASHPAGMESGRDPCPWRVLDDTGVAFAMGTLGGGVFHSIKGALNSPPSNRFRGAVSAVRLRSPVTGGAFASWMILFSSWECALIHLRHKEDHFNPIMAGFFTGAMLAVRQGPGAMVRQGAAGAAVLAVFEGIAILVDRTLTTLTRPKQPQLPMAESK